MLRSISSRLSECQLSYNRWRRRTCARPALIPVSCRLPSSRPPPRSALAGFRPAPNKVHPKMPASRADLNPLRKRRSCAAYFEPHLAARSVVAPVITCGSRWDSALRALSSMSLMRSLAAFQFRIGVRSFPSAAAHRRSQMGETNDRRSMDRHLRLPSREVRNRTRSRHLHRLESERNSSGSECRNMPPPPCLTERMPSVS